MWNQNDNIYLIGSLFMNIIPCWNEFNFDLIYSNAAK